MAVTAGGTPYVESSDLVANYPAVSLALAEHIDDLPQTVLQVVRATDSTNRTTTSTSYVDASLSVTITPQNATSVVLLIASQNYELTFNSGTNQFGQAQITDSSNNPISGAESTQFGIFSVTTVGSGKFGNQLTLLGYATPASTSAQSYKVRYRVSTGTTTANIRNSSTTGQMYALEISA